jgi:hypothetical protein
MTRLPDPRAAKVPSTVPAPWPAEARATLLLLALSVFTTAGVLVWARDTKEQPKSDTPPVIATEAAEEPGLPEALIVPGERSAATQEPAPVKLSFGVDDIVKMVQRGVELEIVLTYIENSTIPYYLKAEEIVYLHDLGVPSTIVTALIRHGGNLRKEQAQIARQTAASWGSVSTQTAGDATVSQPAQTSYTYNYSVASYPACVSPPSYVDTAPVYNPFPYRGSYLHRPYFRSYLRYPRYGFYPRYYWHRPGYVSVGYHGYYRTSPRYRDLMSYRCL